jgi:hypothetical protein
MSMDQQRHYCGGSHIPTTPDERRYMEGRLEEVGGGIDICVSLPAAGAGIRTAGFAVGFSDDAAGMAGLGGVGLVHLDDLNAKVTGFVTCPPKPAALEALKLAFPKPAAVGAKC